MFESLLEYPFIASLVKGGFVMIPLLACSLLGATVIVERLIWGPSKSRVIPEDLQREAHRLLSLGRLAELQGICRANPSPLARILLAALRDPSRSRGEIIDAMEVVGKKEAFILQKRLGILGTIAAVGPLLGLLGTVFGMISTFHVISEHGTGDPGLMATGISEALITTATGLTVAIPALLFYRFFLQRAKQLIVEMEVIVLSLFEEFSILASENAAESPASAVKLSSEPRK